MKEMITRKNVVLFVAHRYGISIQELFKTREENYEFFKTVIEDLFEEFTSCIVAKKQKFLETFNPYTQKMENFEYSRSRGIDSFNQLMENLSNVHHQRMAHLNKSFYQELGIEKQKEKQLEKEQRTAEIEALLPEGRNRRELEQ